MVVDDDDIRRGGALAHARHEAVVVARTLGAETGVCRRRDLVPEREVFRQVPQLGAVADLGPRRPFPDHRQEHVVHRGAGAVLQLIQLVQAQIVRAPLHAGRRERNAQRLAQRRNVLEVDLLGSKSGIARASGPSGEKAAVAASARSQVCRIAEFPSCNPAILPSCNFMFPGTGGISGTGSRLRRAPSSTRDHRPGSAARE